MKWPKSLRNTWQESLPKVKLDEPRSAYFRLLTTKITTTECRATFNHGPNEPARLARQWIKERSISCFCEVWGSYIYRLVWLVWLASASKNPALSVGFMYLAARLARQWMKERSISWSLSSFGSSGSPVHLRTRHNLYCVKCGVHVFSGSFSSSGSAVDQRTKYFPLPSQTSRLVWSMVKSGPAFCSLATLEQ